ncbi:MAG: hypothetical protein LJE70_08430 [Chromatiaceae bacterium]|nr:hypothetical protein [Chromatiaceae bacterium]
MQIKVANDNGKSILNVLDILDEGVNIYCTNIDFDRRLLTLDNRTEHATADFNMKELDEYCDQATPSGHVHIKCKFDGQRRFDLTSNYREVMQGRTTTGQQKVSQVSASCSVAVSGAGEPFTDLEGELTQSWTD